MEEKKIRLREEIPLEDTWATEDMFATDEAWEAELASLAERGQFTSHNTDKLDWAVRYSGGLSATVAQIDAHQHEAERLAKVLPVPEITRAFMEILKRLELPIRQRQYAALACIEQAV